MLNQFAVEIPTLRPISEGMLSRSSGVSSRREGPPSIWDTWYIGKRFFANPVVSSTALYSPKNRTHGVHRARSRFIHPQWKEWKVKTRSRSEMPVWTVSQKFSHLQWRRLFKELWSRPTTTANFGSSLWQIPHTSYVCLLEDKIQDWGMYLLTISYGSWCNGSKKWRWLIQWMIFKFSSSTRGIPMPNFEVLDARIASALNRIIHNSTLQKKNQSGGTKGPRQDRFFRGRQMAYLIYEYSRVTGANDSVENYADLFTIGLRNDDNQEFDSKWDGILLSMTRIPPGDILEGLYKLRIRESEKLKTVLELYDLEIHQKKAGPEYHRIANDGEKKYRARSSK